MRAMALVALFLIAGTAGCFDRDSNSSKTPAIPPLQLNDITVPADALMSAIDGGFAAVWNNKTLPWVVDITVPAHATMIRAVADSGASAVSMYQLETGRRRCNNPTVEDFSTAFAYPKSCSSVAALDIPGAQWHVTFSGSGQGHLRIEFLDRPLDGLLANLDLSKIDPPTQSLQDTEVLFIPSHDGVKLRVEVTRPQGSGPWPAILVSSPYYTHVQGAAPADWRYVVQDWAKRGYAMVTADVRGFADSGGCVEVWGIKEQLDQKFLVDWVAGQTWSDGNVGFYGQSYVGTTPVEAAVQAPAALKAIVTIAPVINAYDDWHYGGVPNGENELSPVAYQVLTESTVTEVPAEAPEGAFLNDPQQLANNAANGLCDPTLVVRANDPRATYNAFYDERNFKTRADKVKAAVLYTQGFEDANVKSAMIPGWFNELQSPKLGLFGHWLHQHPSRLDCEVLFVGWFETHLKHKDLGFDTLPQVAVAPDRERHRTAASWPPIDALDAPFSLNFNGQLGNPSVGALVEGAGNGGGNRGIQLGPAPGAAPAQLGYPTLTLTGTLGNNTALAGVGSLHLKGTFTGAGTGYVGAQLWNDDRLITWGQVNLAHSADHRTYTPLAPNVVVTTDLPLRPTEHIFEAGTTIRLILSGVSVQSALDPFGSAGVSFLISGTDSLLHLPGVPIDSYHAMPLTARP